MFGVRPVNEIEPLVPPQLVGLENCVVAIAGVGFTTTLTVPGKETQLLTVTVKL